MINKPLKLLAVSVMLCSANVSFAAAIHNAVQTNDIGKVQRIVRENPSQLYSFDENGQTPIHLAIENDSIPSLASLMGNGPVNLNIQNSEGDTPLVYAIKLNKSNSILFLLQKGSNPYYTDSSGQNALYYVKKFGNADTRMIFTEVMKYQEENARRMSNQVAQTKSSSNKNGTKSVDELIAENAVQRELLGQTQTQLNQPPTNQNNFNNNDAQVKVNPIKDNGFIYQDDLNSQNNDEQSSNTEVSENKKINDLSLQVTQLTDLLKQVLKPNQQQNTPIIEQGKIKSDPIKQSQPLVVSKETNIENEKKADPETDSKIKAFIALNEKVGNEVPDKFKPKEQDQPKPLKDSSVGIYQTQERGLTVSQERSIIPNNWSVNNEQVLSNTNNENKDNDSKNDPIVSQEENVIPEPKKMDVEIKSASEKSEPKELIPQKDIPSMLLKQTITKNAEPEKIIEKETKIPDEQNVLNEEKPLITEAQKKNIEEKIHDENERSVVMNAIIASAFTVLILGLLGIASFFGYRVLVNKKKVKTQEKIEQNTEHDQNRERIKNRLVNKTPWNENKKPE